MNLPGRDPEVDALRTDRYLESLLAAADRRAYDAPGDSAVEATLRDTAARLRRALVRVHPSFRFEDRLATRLADAAAAMRLAPAAGAEGSIRTISIAADDDDEAVNADEGFRPLLIGGALTSAALSIAGAAYVAWRRTRPGRRATSPMARAVRAARTTRQRAGRTAARIG
jgi:hypothetical protein